MNKLFAALMTAMILGTVAVVFVLGIMSLGGLSENTTSEADQATSDSALTYGTDFTDWQSLTAAARTQWRYEEADDGRQLVRLRRILSPALQVHALVQDTGLVVRAYQRTVCQQGETQMASTPENGEAKSLLCVADRDGATWLRGESALSAPARWQEDFGAFVVDVDLSTWEWQAARQIAQSVAVSL
tara:strand:+ start:341 stop:901 length:561 start_codon:yes stop_codon:yes gene_type:complete